MRSGLHLMERAPGLIAVDEFKNLLTDLQSIRPDVCVRYRLLGELWAVNFMSVALVNDKTLLLNDDQSHKLILISDLSNIMQFELDKPFRGFQPHYHYDVKPFMAVQND